MDKVDPKSRLKRLKTIIGINVLILLINAFMAVSTKNHLIWGLGTGVWVLTLTMNIIGLRVEMSRSAQNPTE